MAVSLFLESEQSGFGLCQRDRVKKRKKTDTVKSICKCLGLAMKAEYGRCVTVAELVGLELDDLLDKSKTQKAKW